MAEYVNTLKLDADVEDMINAVDNGNLMLALRALVAASTELGINVSVVPDHEDSESVHVSNGEFGFILHGNNAMSHLGG